MVRKSFFRKRTSREMQDSLKMRRVNWQRGLVDKIWNLSVEEGLILMSPLIPASFLKNFSQSADSRKHYKWGDFLPINQPRSQEEAYNAQPYIPLIGRMRAFDELKALDERDIHYLGISWRPVQGNDRRLRLVPFDSVIEAVNIVNYAHSVGTGIDINAKYTNSQIVQREGGQIFCKVPSRTKDRKKYNLVLRHVPLLPGKEENAVILSLDHNFIGDEPERETYLHNLRYSFAQGNQTSDRIVFGPHEIAAYLETIKKEWKGFDKTVPLRMNPFPLPSREFFSYGQKLDNNVLIYDTTLQSKDKLRNLHLDEKCILLGRAIPLKGAWNTVYWDSNRDGKLTKYRCEDFKYLK